jgi:VIT1/CCC1 family predicted Fe2+/Mn2+ transporter
MNSAAALFVGLVLAFMAIFILAFVLGWYIGQEKLRGKLADEAEQSQQQGKEDK